MRLTRLQSLILLALLALFLLVVIRSRRFAALPTSQRNAIPERVGPPWAYPDPAQTPGATNPDITEENINENICNQHFALAGSTGDYEEDHLISLELGGHPTDPRNLWPEPYSPFPGAGEKDLVENYLHRQVCSGTITLRQAQTAIASDWYAVYLQIHH